MAVDALTQPTPAQMASRAVGPDDLPWALWMEGLEVQLLRCSVATGEYTLLVRFAPGVELPRHRHFGPVHAWTIQGRWSYLEYDWEAVTGTYVHEPPGSVHTLKVDDDNDGDTLIVFAMTGGLVMLGPNDELWMYEDAESALERYRFALDQQGVPFPDGILD